MWPTGSSRWTKKKKMSSAETNTSYHKSCFIRDKIKDGNTDICYKQGIGNSESLTGVTNLQNWPIFQSLSKGPFLSKLEYSCSMVIGDLHETINISLSERNMALSTGYAKLSFKKVIFQEYFYCISFIFYSYPINTFLQRKFLRN